MTFLLLLLAAGLFAFMTLLSAASGAPIVARVNFTLFVIALALMIYVDHYHIELFGGHR